jgi:hypothetical protein
MGLVSREAFERKAKDTVGVGVNHYVVIRLSVDGDVLTLHMKPKGERSMFPTFLRWEAGRVTDDADKDVTDDFWIDE